jgi:hypothetical protein
MMSVPVPVAKTNKHNCERELFVSFLVDGFVLKLHCRLQANCTSVRELDVYLQWFLSSGARKYR